jgi:hypothetical protein
MRPRLLRSGHWRDAREMGVGNANTTEQRLQELYDADWEQLLSQSSG